MFIILSLFLIQLFQEPMNEKSYFSGNLISIYIILIVIRIITCYFIFLFKVLSITIYKMNKVNKLSSLYKTCISNKIVLDIETDGADNILQIAYNMYDVNNNLIQSKDFFVYDGEHFEPVFPTINKNDIINDGISLKDASNIVTQDINNADIIIGHNVKSFDLRCINKLNDKFNNKIKDTLIIHDTMIESKHIIKAKNKIGRLKYPRLDELLKFLCNKKIENYHCATGDILATFDCYKVLCDKYNCFTTITNKNIKNDDNTLITFGKYKKQNI